MTVRQSEKVARIFLWAAALVTVGTLVLIIGYIFKEGFSVLSIDFLLDAPRKMGAKGGIFPSIVGTVYLTVMTLLFSVPLGVGGGDLFE